MAMSGRAASAPRRRLWDGPRRVRGHRHQRPARSPGQGLRAVIRQPRCRCAGCDAGRAMDRDASQRPRNGTTGHGGRRVRSDLRAIRFTKRRSPSRPILPQSRSSPCDRRGEQHPCVACAASRGCGRLSAAFRGDEEECGYGAPDCDAQHPPECDAGPIHAGDLTRHRGFEDGCTRRHR